MRQSDRKGGWGEGERGKREREEREGREGRDRQPDRQTDTQTDRQKIRKRHGNETNKKIERFDKKEE